MALVTCIFISALITYYFMTRPGRLPEDAAWVKDYKYAHRGYHDKYCPENSMGAFLKAIEYGYAIEFDVQLSKDCVPMVFHDDTLTRMTGIEGAVSDYDAHELNNIKLAGTEYTIPTMESVLQAVKGSTPLLIELKNTGYAGKLEKNTWKQLKNYNGKFIIQSFSPFSVAWFKKNAPNILRGQLSSNFKGVKKTGRLRVKSFMLGHLLTNFLCRPQLIDYDIRGIKRPIIKRMRNSGAAVLAWTVKNPETAINAGQFSDSIIFEGFEPKQALGTVD